MCKAKSRQYFCIGVFKVGGLDSDLFAIKSPTQDFSLDFSKLQFSWWGNLPKTKLRCTGNLYSSGKYQMKVLSNEHKPFVQDKLRNFREFVENPRTMPCAPLIHDG